MRLSVQAYAIGMFMSLAACVQDSSIPRIEAAAQQPDTTPARSFFARINDHLQQTFAPRRISIEERQRLGDALTDAMLKQVRLSQDEKRLARVRGIMRRLAAADDSGLKWQVYVVDDPKPNAFTTGGGHLFITTGMLDILEDDGQIATVLAHEMAHNRLAHVVLAEEKRQLAKKAHEFSKEVLEKRWNMAWLGKSLSFIVNTSLNTYSRTQEDEADEEGMALLVKAGYKPQVMLKTFDRMRAIYKEKSGLSNFFYGNHPLYSDRRWHIENLIRAHYRAQAGLPPPRPPNFGPRRRVNSAQDHEGRTAEKMRAGAEESSLTTRGVY